MDTRERIYNFIKKEKKVTANTIVEQFDLSRWAIYKHLNKLLDERKISKIGKPPKVFYFVSEAEHKAEIYTVSDKIKNFIDKRFLDISPGGIETMGWQGFIQWCQKRRLEVVSSANDFVKIVKKYDSIRKDGLLDGMKKMKSTFSKVYLDKLFYLDFYSIERFGKTKLGKELLYAKQSQDRKLIKNLVKDIKEPIDSLIEKYKIEAVVFIPPTVKRELQFMKELEKLLKLALPKIKVFKIKTPVIVPQKTLGKLEDRIENAKNTFIVEESRRYNNLLLIDDAVGSGSTLNEIARQLKDKNIAKGKIIGLSITGSIKGFDVISEV
jgi:hypoxanthine-guanine phosphoribosyltransferase